jgi:NADH-quinone oxidoreductase subunit J
VSPATAVLAADLTPAQWTEFVAFVILAPVSVVAALAMVFNRNAIHGALLLVVNFFCLAVFYLLLDAQFLFVVQIAVYAGAIMVLFLFVLMLLGVDRREVLTETIKGQRVWAVVLGVVLLAGVVTAVVTGAFPTESAGLAAANQGGNVRAIGRLLFTRYTLAFEATGVLLLVAGVAALVLARPGRTTSLRGDALLHRGPVDAETPDAGAAAPGDAEGGQADQPTPERPAAAGDGQGDDDKERQPA